MLLLNGGVDCVARSAEGQAAMSFLPCTFLLCVFWLLLPRKQVSQTIIEARIASYVPDSSTLREENLSSAHAPQPGTRGVCDVFLSQLTQFRMQYDLSCKLLEVLVSDFFLLHN